MVGDSPDGISCLVNCNGCKEVCAFELRTMTAPRTIEELKQTRTNYAPILSIKNIGVDQHETSLYHSVIPNGSYRMQRLHHAAVMGVGTVLFVVAKGGNTAVGEVIDVVILRYEQDLISNYLFCLDCIRETAFRWVGKPSAEIPAECG